mgnify:CR=1 FL=1
MAKKYKRITLDDRYIIEQKYLEGVSVAEIAEIIGVSQATVYRELARGYAGTTDKNGRPAYSVETAQVNAVQGLKRQGGRPFLR